MHRHALGDLGKERSMADKSGAIEKVSRIAPAEIQRLVFGVRYEPQYKLLDRIGTVTDEILRVDGTPFGPDTFPLSEVTSLRYRLLNAETTSELLVNSQDTILQIALKTRDESWIDQWATDFEEYVLGPLRHVGGVKNIVRYGLVVHFKEVSASSLSTPPITRYLMPDFQKANSLALRFSRRLSADEALVKKRVDDFKNAIYQIEQSEASDVRISIDYQEYFQPPLDAGEWDSKPFSTFANRGTEYLSGEFRKWLQQFVAASEVA
jgi:hypothetical protein